jgi:hypothetical protein
MFTWLWKSIHMQNTVSPRTLALTFAASLCLALPASAETLTPMRMQDFRDGIGVNTHLNYKDTSYVRVEYMVAALQYVGIDQVRDQSPTPWVGGSAPIHEYKWAMQQGINYNFIALGGAFTLQKTTDQLEALAEAVPGRIAAIEGFNEVDHAPVTYMGATGADAAVAAQKALFAGIRANARLKSIPIYDVTGVAYPTSLTGRADYMNVHIYPQNGNASTVWFQRLTDNAESLKMPLVVTEFGYASMPQSGWLVIGVNDKVQAKATMNGLFNGFADGVTRTYLYELFDQKADASNKNREMHFGMFTNTREKKPLAIAMHNMTTILTDTGATRKTFKTTAMSINLNTLPAQVRRLLIQKSDGTRILALWQDVTMWDRATGKAITTQPVTVKIPIPTGLKATGYYNMTAGTASVQSFAATAKTVSIKVPDYPVFLELKP